MDKPGRERLLANWFDGELSESESNDLRAEMERDDAFREQAAKLLVIRRNLARGQVPEGDFSRQVIEMLRGPDEENDLRETVVTRLKTRQRRNNLVIGLAAAAMVVAGLFFVLTPPPDEPGIRVVAAESIGTLKLERLYRGERVRLKRGIMEIDLTRKSRVVIEGPAAFSIPSPDFVQLVRGRCFAEMEKGESGLRIETPAGEVLDLGTKFAVDVSSSKQTEVHVFDGEVKVSGNAVQTRIKQGEAVAFETTGVRREFAARRGSFVSHVPEGAMDAPACLHWAFDEGEGDLVHARGRGEYLEQARGRLNSEPLWIDGVFGKAVQFNGSSSWVATAHPGIGGESDRTVACWVRIPKDWSRSDAAPLVSWGLIKSRTESGRGWMLSLSRHKERFGSLRLSLGEQQVVGATRLNDGRWHHVAAVAMKSETGPNVLLYVDGQLENVTRDTLESMDTDIRDSESEAIRFGRQIYWDDLYLRGALDEVFVIRAALSGDQVRSLMRGQLEEVFGGIVAD